ncbi:hypothetical protein ACQKP8_00795 [Photobacterium alginatilyticum]|uniref:hypothetical protein n=1 Tax=Photobacterium alginatilyticum TaxID=1775171 RepID=UPI004067DC3B
MLTEQLFSAYLGELYGIAFFTAFAEKYSDDKHINKWQKLILVEQVTARHLKTGLEKLGISCPDSHPVMEDKGRHDAEKWLSLEWPDLVDTMASWVEPYALKYRHQAQRARQHSELFLLVQEHEDAIFSFLQAEQCQETNSQAALDNFLARYQ